MKLEDVSRAINAAGLVERGAFHPDSDDFPRGARVGTVVMLGFAGSAQWRAFTKSDEYKDGRAHPLDRWSYRVVSLLGLELGAQALFPFTGPPFLPFIRWAQKAEPVRPSVMGMLIHPDYGLWHAWRGALAFEAKFQLDEPAASASPCDRCADKPCLSACPAGAIRQDAYDVPKCAAHLRSNEGAACMSGGCLARRSCPVGQDHKYEPDHAAFHMRSFRGD